VTKSIIYNEEKAVNYIQNYYL